MNSKKITRTQVISSVLDQNKAQIQMSIGTIVAIVLFMVFMVLGLILVRTIFTGSIENINSIDQSVKNEINKLFSEDDTRKIVVYPPTREISIKKGNEGGFGFSIRNINIGSSASESFSYSVSFIESSCSLSQQQAEGLIILGKSGSNIIIPSGSSLEDPVLVKFQISESVPLCSVRYGVSVQNGGAAYGNTVTVDLKILPS
ncbi:hypothetical protein HY448_01825 [Candidatus Pacearchaeota archaeon]|nr:hypothetical protein [Candidatus Pacearchaeota archaeon]